jgi:hypothetical protein
LTGTLRGSDGIRVWADPNRDHLLFGPHGSWQWDYFSNPPPASVYVEGIVPGENTLTWTLSVGDPISDMVRFSVVQADLDTDSNNNGSIDHSIDDPIEFDLEKPGRIVLINSDDDNNNKTPDMDESGPVLPSDDDLAIVKILPVGIAQSQAGQVTATLTAYGGIKVWANSSRSVPILPTTEGSYSINYTSIGSIPSLVYVEGISTGEATLEWSVSSGSIVVGPDIVKFTVVDMPELTVASSSISGKETFTATNNGTWSWEINPKSACISVTSGNLTVEDDGTWSWWKTYTDGGSQSETVSITLSAGVGSPIYDSVSFNVEVKNVAPDADGLEAYYGFSGYPANEGSYVLVKFINPRDPSPEDMDAGLFYSFALSTDDLITTYHRPLIKQSGYYRIYFDDDREGGDTYMVYGCIVDKDNYYNKNFSTSVKVNNVAPTATLINYGPVDEGMPVWVGFTDQYDPSRADRATLHYSFNRDRLLLNTDYDAGSTSPTDVITFDDCGMQVVWGCVMDDDGNSNIYSTTVMVNNTAPDVTFDATTEIAEGSQYLLVLSASEKCSHDSISSWQIDWGDGNIQTVQANYLEGGNSERTQDPTTGKWVFTTRVPHVYADDLNSYLIKVSATDWEHTYTNIADKNITVNNVAPRMTLIGLDSRNEGSPYSLQISSSDPGNDTIKRWLVVWGDGDSTTVTADYNMFGNSRRIWNNDTKTWETATTVPPHIYADDRNEYDITVIATDEDGTYPGADDIATKSITINNVAPSISLASQNGENSVKEGKPFILCITSSDPGNDRIQRFEVDWDDETDPTVVDRNFVRRQQSGTGGWITSVMAPPHVYADGLKNYTIRVIATDEDGTYNDEDKIGKLNIRVDNVAPTAELINNAPKDVNEAVEVQFIDQADVDADTLFHYSFAGLVDQFRRLMRRTGRV